MPDAPSLQRTTRHSQRPAPLEIQAVRTSAGTMRWSVSAKSENSKSRNMERSTEVTKLAGRTLHHLIAFGYTEQGVRGRGLQLNAYVGPKHTSWARGHSRNVNK